VPALLNVSSLWRGGLAAILGSASVLAEPLAGNASDLFDAYLASAAARVSDYRADLQPAATPADAGPGRFFAVGPLAGPFTYRAKSYSELTAAQRTALWRDAGFPEYLRRVRPPLALGLQPPASRERPIRIVLAPAEMLLPRAGSIALPNR
jgi:hypothetical protein